MIIKLTGLLLVLLLINQQAFVSGEVESSLVFSNKQSSKEEKLSSGLTGEPIPSNENLMDLPKVINLPKDGEPIPSNENLLHLPKVINEALINEESPVNQQTDDSEIPSTNEQETTNSTEQSADESQSQKVKAKILDTTKYVTPKPIEDDDDEELSEWVEFETPKALSELTKANSSFNAPIIKPPIKQGSNKKPINSFAFVAGQADAYSNNSKNKNPYHEPTVASYSAPNSFKGQSFYTYDDDQEMPVDPTYPPIIDPPKYEGEYVTENPKPVDDSSNSNDEQNYDQVTYTTLAPPPPTIDYVSGYNYIQPDSQPIDVPSSISNESTSDNSPQSYKEVDHLDEAKKLSNKIGHQENVETAIEHDGQKTDEEINEINKLSDLGDSSKLDTHGTDDKINIEMPYSSIFQMFNDKMNRIQQQQSISNPTVVAFPANNAPANSSTVQPTNDPAQSNSLPNAKTSKVINQSPKIVLIKPTSFPSADLFRSKFQSINTCSSSVSILSIQILIEKFLSYHLYRRMCY